MSALKRNAFSAIVAICFVSLCISDGFAQPGGGGRFGGGGGFGGRAEDLLRRDDVRKELELVDDQIKQLDELNNRRREGGRDLFSGLQDLSQEERAAKMREIFTKMAEDRKKELDKVLLPHQSKRLDQLVAQYGTRGGSTRALTGGNIADELGITDDQKDNIRKKAEELQKELDKKVAELRKELQDEVLNELTASQRAKYKSMMGSAFEFQQQQFGRGGNNGGGAQGGNRGGGNRGAGNRGGGNRQRPDAE